MAHAPDTSSPTLRFDIIAGLTASAVVLPKAMAYATVAGLSVSVGLYTAFVPMIVYALLGTSRVLSVSSTTTLAILSGAQLGLAVPDGDPGKLMIAAATLTALTGAFLIAASVLRLGFVANFISIPVLTGFKAGIGMVIVLDQLPKLFGIHITKEGFFRDILSVVRHLPETSMITLAIGAATLVALAVMERLKPHSPAPLAAVGRRHRRIVVLWPERPWRVDRRSDPAVASPDYASRPRSRATALAGGAWHRLDELYRNDGRRACFCPGNRPPDQSQSGTSRDRGSKPFGSLLWRHARQAAAHRRPWSSARSAAGRKWHRW